MKRRYAQLPKDDYQPRWTEDMVNDWTDNTFGEKGTPFSVTQRALEEAVELGYAAEQDHKKIPEECADITIILVRLAHRIGVKARDARTEIPQRSYPGHTMPQLVALVQQNLALLAGNAAQDPVNPFARIHMWTSIVIMDIMVDMLGGKLWRAVDRKMDINAKHKWKLRGDGHGDHVKEAGAA